MIKAQINVIGGEYPTGHFQNKKLFFARSSSRIMGLCDKFIGTRKAIINLTFEDGTKKEIPINQD